MTLYLEMNKDQFAAQPNYDDHYFSLLGVWRAEKMALDTAKANELHYRTLLAELTFANPVEGTQTFLFGDDKKTCAKLVMTQPINRTIDPAAITDCLATLRETIGTIADTVVRFKPDLAVGVYKSLTPEQQAILAPAITAKPGTPQLEFKDAK